MSVYIFWPLFTASARPSNALKGWGGGGGAKKNRRRRRVASCVPCSRGFMVRFTWQGIFRPRDGHLAALVCAPFVLISISRGRQESGKSCYFAQGDPRPHVSAALVATTRSNPLARSTHDPFWAFNYIQGQTRPGCKEIGHWRERDQYAIQSLASRPRFFPPHAAKLVHFG